MKPQISALKDLTTVQGLKYPQARIDAMKDAAALKQEVSLLGAEEPENWLEVHVPCSLSLDLKVWFCLD